MARMYPDPISPKTDSAAERRLYELFKSKLGADYTVFHSVGWQALDNHRRPQDGEADFVIAHEKLGILLLEVKGGRIDYDPASGHWTSTDRGGTANPLKRSPVEQVMESKHTLKRLIEGQIGGLVGNIGHAVAFPDIGYREEDRLPNLAREIVLDSTDMADVGGWVERALRYYRGDGSGGRGAPGKEAVTALKKLLGKAREFRPVLWGEFVAEGERLIRLTEEQYGLLDTLSLQRRALICGCAGSGKTVLAVEKAARLANQGFRVLLTSFNKGLANSIRAQLGTLPSNLDIAHFHDLCTGLARKAGISLNQRDDAKFFEEELPTALMDAADKLPEDRYDAIIVDEAQDFQELWWEPLQCLLHDPDDGILYIFYDDNQNIYTREGSFPIAGSPYPLPVNCRNTKQIHTQVVKFYKDSLKPISRGPEGRPVEIVPYEDDGVLRVALQNLLRKLVREAKIPTDEITILTPLGKAKSGLWGPVTPGSIALTESWPTAANQVFCTTIHGFKGLERSVIILAETARASTATNLQMLLYVGASRARNQLYVLSPENKLKQIRELFG